MDKEKEILLMKLGDNIRKIRKVKGLTQQELASLVNKDYQSIQRLERGDVNPSYYYLVEISRGLETDLTELIDFHDE